MVTTLQVDDCVYVVGQDDFRVARYTLGEWIGEEDQEDPRALRKVTDMVRFSRLRLNCGRTSAKA